MPFLILNSMSVKKFTLDNFKSGFLMDEELMAGISESVENKGQFTAYVIRHTTGETLGAQEFSDPFEAIRTLNDIPRLWTFEKVSKCGSGNCGNGQCGKEGGGCKKKTTEPCATGSC